MTTVLVIVLALVISQLRSTKIESKQLPKVKESIIELPSLNTEISYRYKDLEGNIIFRQGRITQVCPHFIPACVQVTSNDIKGHDYRYVYVSHLGIDWWYGPNVNSQQDIILNWERTILNSLLK